MITIICLRGIIASALLLTPRSHLQVLYFVVDTISPVKKPVKNNFAILKKKTKNGRISGEDHEKLTSTFGPIGFFLIIRERILRTSFIA